MGEVVPARTTPTLHPPIPSHCAVITLFKSVPVHQLSWLVQVVLYKLICYRRPQDGEVRQFHYTGESICRMLSMAPDILYQKNPSGDSFQTFPSISACWVSHRILGWLRDICNIQDTRKCCGVFIKGKDVIIVFISDNFGVYNYMCPLLFEPTLVPPHHFFSTLHNYHIIQHTCISFHQVPIIDWWTVPACFEKLSQCNYI